jgi:hypothetical protein
MGHVASFSFGRVSIMKHRRNHAWRDIAGNTSIFGLALPF